MTDQNRSQWPAASSADPQLSFVQPPASPGSSGQSVYLLSPPQADYASWGQRLRARLIDQGPTYLGLIIFFASSRLIGCPSTQRIWYGVPRLSTVQVRSTSLRATAMQAWVWQ